MPYATLMNGLTSTCGLIGHSYPTPNCGPIAVDVITSVPSAALCDTNPIPTFRQRGRLRLGHQDAVAPNPAGALCTAPPPVPIVAHHAAPSAPLSTARLPAPPS